MCKNGILILFFIFLSLSIKSQEYNSTRIEVNIYPELNLINNALLGEKVYSKEIINFRRGAFLKDTIFAGNIIESGWIMPGQLLYLRENDNWIQYISFKYSMLFIRGAAYNGEPLVCVNKKNNLVEKITYSNYPMNRPHGPRIKNVNPIKLEEKDLIDRSDRNFEKKILFSGYNDNKLKLKYLEFTENKTFPDYFLDLEFDLSKNRTVEFKGLKIDILKCDNQKLIYKILSDIAE